MAAASAHGVPVRGDRILNGRRRLALTICPMEQLASDRMADDDVYFIFIVCAHKKTLETICAPLRAYSHTTCARLYVRIILYGGGEEGIKNEKKGNVCKKKGEEKKPQYVADNGAAAAAVGGQRKQRERETDGHRRTVKK